MADIRGEWIRSLSWRSSEELRYCLVTMDFFSDFLLYGAGRLVVALLFFMGTKTADKLFACQPFLY